MSAEGGARSVPSTGFITVTGVPVCTSTGPGLFTATQPTTASTASTGTTAYFGCGPGSRWTPAAGSRSYVPICVSRVGLSSTCCDTAPGPPSLERLSVIRGPDGRIARIHYVLPRHKAANWVGPGRGRKSTRPGANGVVVAFRLLSECETIPGLRPLGNLRLLRTSCPRTRPDPEDPHVRDRHPQPLTGIGREASKPRERPTGTRSAQTREQRH